MSLLSGFNAADVEPQDAFEVLPQGKYSMVIVASEDKETRNGLGAYLELRLQVVEGKYKGRTLFDRLNLKNNNPVAVEIANKTLSAICRACNVMTPNDSSELHDICITVSVGHDKRSDNGELTNVIKGYSICGPATSSTPTGEINQQPVSDSKPPWQK